MNLPGYGFSCRVCGRVVGSFKYDKDRLCPICKRKLIKAVNKTLRKLSESSKKGVIKPYGSGNGKKGVKP